MNRRIKHFISLASLAIFLVFAVGSTAPTCDCCGASIDKDSSKVMQFTDGIFCDSDCFANYGFYKWKCK